MDAEIRIEKFIARIIREYRKKRAVKGLIAGLLIGVIILFLLYLLRIIILLDYKAVSVLVFPALAGAFLGFFLPVNIPQILSRADSFLNLEEMLITYQEYVRKDKGNIFLPFIKERLAKAVDERKTRGLFRVKAEREIRIMAVILICLLFLSIWMDFSANNQREFLNKSTVVSVEGNENTASKEEKDKVSSGTQDIPEEYRQKFFELSQLEFDIQAAKLKYRSDEMEEAGGNLGDLEMGEENNMLGSEDFSTDEKEEEKHNISGSGRKNDTGENDQRSRGAVSPSDDDNPGAKDGLEKENIDNTEYKDSNLADGERDTAGRNADERTVSSVQDERFRDTQKEYSKIKLEPVINNINANSYIAELMRPDLEGDEQDISMKDLISYRNFMINSLDDPGIPAVYKELAREYFKRIIKE